MTEEKRFKLDYEEDDMVFIIDSITDKYYEIINDTTSESKLNELVELLNKQDKENKLLREMLKNSYINEICENCEYGHYYGYEVPFEGIEYDFECLKKHFGKEHWRCDGLKECDDFKLKLEELE